jgi:hypothetical protein
MTIKRIFPTVVLLVVACTVLWGMQSTTPNYNRLLAPIESRGKTGNFVRGRTIALRVDGVEVARSLHGKCLDGERSFDTTGVWVIVHATASSVERPEMLASTVLESPDGTRYAHSQRPEFCSDLLYEAQLQPDVPTSGDLIYELPAGALKGADLIAANVLLGLNPLDSELRIHLGLDAAASARVLAAIRNVYSLPVR